MSEMILFAVLMYLYKCRNINHIVVMMILVALLGKNRFWSRDEWVSKSVFVAASVTVISVKAVSGMITETIRGSHLQLTYPIFYIMFIIMVISCGFQIKCV